MPARPSPRSRLPAPPSPAQAGGFAAQRLAADAHVLQLFDSAPLRAAVRDRRTQMGPLWTLASRALMRLLAGKAPETTALTVHRRLVAGLPGESLFIAAALAFDALEEALPLFDVTAKTARSRVGERLSANEGEAALRIARAFACAALMLGTADAARRYLRTPNFALGGVTPRELLQTAEGEDLVLAELQAQASGAPV